MNAKQAAAEERLSLSKIIGDFGEDLVATLLAKRGIAVAHAPMEGFDLLALDKKGTVLTKGKLVGISVKTRLLTDNFVSAHTIPIGTSQARKAARIWEAEPWLAVVCGTVGNTLEVFIVPYSESRSFAGRTTSGDKISVTALRNEKSGRANKLLTELTFDPPRWLSIQDVQEKLKAKGSDSPPS